MGFTEIDHAAENRRDEYVRLARELFAKPELAYEEFESQAKLVAMLEANGFTVETGIAGFPTSFRAEYGNAADGPTVAILAEYDALKDLGHACGHNLIAVSAVGAGIALKDAHPQLPGRIVVLGTPAEETAPPTKALMFERGAFEGVEMTMRFHGDDVTNTRKRRLAADVLEFKFKGVPSHAAAKPEAGISALDAVMLMTHGVEILREHVHPEARIHGIITDGGQAVNIIPEFAATKYQIRGPNRPVVEAITARVKNCAKGAALAVGAELTIVELGEYWNTLPAPALEERLLKYAADAGAIQIQDSTLRASNDIGLVTHHMPTACIDVAMTPVGITQHTHEFLEASDRQEGFDAMLVGIKAMAATAYDYMVDGEFRRTTNEQHAREREASQAAAAR